jgi:ADP-ribose pyrophosphatase YjhB (NUDIX family)
MRRDRAQAIVVRDDKILMVKHNINGREFFCIPGGGVEGCETYEEAALRELKEEGCVDGKIVRKLSVQYKPDDRGEVHTFLIDVDEEQIPRPGIDPEFSAEEQTIIGIEWLGLDEIGEVDKAYLWASGLNRIDEFHKKLLDMDNELFR